MLLKTDDNTRLNGLVFVNETSNLDSREITGIDVHDKHGVFYVSFDTILHSFNVMNRNGRKYLADNVWKCITGSEKLQSLMNDKGWFGEMNHPTQYYVDKKLTPERLQDIDMANRSHKIMNPQVTGNLLKAHIQTSSGTDAGVGFAKEIIQGLHPAFSCRAVAVMEMMNGEPTVIVRRLITYDWVLYPSHKEAHAITDPKLKAKIIPVITESGTDEKSDYYSDFIMPLKDILVESTETDDNLSLIMESFHLGYDDIVGVDKSHNHVIVKDNDNVIYADINPKTKHRLNDFFSSF